MSLEHVFVWIKEESRWIRMQAEDAYKKRGGKIPAAKKELFCKTCGQYVTLAWGETKGPHFKHSKSDQDKDCEERSKATIKFQQERATCPIDLCLRLTYSHKKQRIRLDVGVKLHSAGFLENAEKEACQLCIFTYGTSPEQRLLTLSLHTRNFARSGLTYHPIERVFCEEYGVKILSKNGESRQQPTFLGDFPGLRPGGTLFDCRTGKRRSNMEIVTGKSYYLLAEPPVEFPIYGIDPRKAEGIVVGQGCVLYKVVPRRITRETARFFQKFDCTLVDASTTVSKLSLVWPPVLEKDGFVESQRSPLYFVMKGNSSLKVEPKAAEGYVTEYAGRLRLVRVENKEPLDLCSEGESHLVLRQGGAGRERREYKLAEAMTMDWEPFTGGLHTVLPPDRRLCVWGKYDGTVERRKDGWVCQIWKMRVGKPVILDDISWGEDIVVYHGMDEALSLSFRRQGRGATDDDGSLYAALRSCRGNEISIGRRHAWLLAELKNMPQTTAFVRSAMRKGGMPYGALRLILEKIGKEGVLGK